VLISIANAMGVDVRTGVLALATHVKPTLHAIFAGDTHFAVDDAALFEHPEKVVLDLLAIAFF